MDKGNNFIDCTKCVNFFVTWDKNFPKGCRLFGFKSANPPSKAVHEATGNPCQNFQKKTPRTK